MPLVDSPQSAPRSISIDGASIAKHTSVSKTSTNATNTTQKTRRKTTNSFDEIIPHPDEVKCRNLILCFDGTGDQFDDDVSALCPPLCMFCTSTNVANMDSELKHCQAILDAKARRC